MKKQNLLRQIDSDLLDSLFGFCYARTRDSNEARELCSDIVFALVKAARTDGEIAHFHAFVWKVARNVYADFSRNRQRNAEFFYSGNAEDLLPFIADRSPEEDREELLDAVFRRIAFLSKAYREVMILYYLDGCTVAQIAERQHTSADAIRQRLFSARKKIKNEVETMAEMDHKPLTLDQIHYVIWGAGSPAWGDPRNVCCRMFSNHIVWLCRQKPMTASEIAEKLNVPTVYVEEELEILTKGENGSYGLLRRTGNGRYSINFILMDTQTAEKAHALYTEQLPEICRVIRDFIEEHRADYLAFPYLNQKADLNLILWQQVFTMADAFSDHVQRIMEEKYFSSYKKPDRPFTVFGYVDNGRHYGGGWDGVEAENVCGFSKIHLDNIYITRIRAHFHCGLNVSLDPQIQLALRAIRGLPAAELSEADKEHAAKAIECGYLYRDGAILYTKILVSSLEDRDRLFEISKKLSHGFFEKQAAAVAEKSAVLIQKTVPSYLLDEWRFAAMLAGMPLFDAVADALIEQGLLIPPKDGIGAEGCWMQVQK